MGADKAAALAKGGTHGTIGILPIGKKVSSDFATDMDKLLGLEIEGDTGSRWRLCRLNVAAGITDPGRRVFKYSAEVTNGYDVEMVAAQTDRPCGVAHADQVALVDNDYFWLQIEGICALENGDDGTDTTAGDYIKPDNDALKGYVITNTTTFVAGVTFARALETQAGAQGTSFLAQILYKLVG